MALTMSLPKELLLEAVLYLDVHDLCALDVCCCLHALTEEAASQQIRARPPSLPGPMPILVPRVLPVKSCKPVLKHVLTEEAARLQFLNLPRLVQICLPCTPLWKQRMLYAPQVQKRIEHPHSSTSPLQSGCVPSCALLSLAI